MASVADKKQQDASSAARIRDNQRRSRARRRELIEELKARVREYERQGVQATLEMRQAARRVALENSRLRSLLASRGVTSEQVDQYLASFNDQPQGLSPTMAVTPPSGNMEPLRPELPRQQAVQGNHGCKAPCSQRTPNARYSAEPVMVASQQSPHPPHTTQPLPAHSNTTVSSPASDYYSSSTTPTGISALDTLAVVADASIRQTCCGPTTQCTPADNQHITVQGHEPPTPNLNPSLGCCGPTTQCTPADNQAVTVQPLAPTPPNANPSLACGGGGGGGTSSPSSPSSLPPPPPQSDSYPTTTPPPPPSSTSTTTAGSGLSGSHMEMSCTAAAHIMASICRDSTEEKAREAMGCEGPGECFVKNTVLFQLLDSAGAV